MSYAVLASAPPVILNSEPVGVPRLILNVSASICPVVRVAIHCEVLVNVLPSAIAWLEARIPEPFVVTVYFLCKTISLAAVYAIVDGLSKGSGKSKLLSNVFFNSALLFTNLGLMKSVAPAPIDCVEAKFWPASILIS